MPITARQIERRLRRALDHLNTLATHTPNAVAALRAEARSIDGLTTPTDSPGTKSGHSDPTATAATGRLSALYTDLDNLELVLITIETSLGLIETFNGRWAPIAFDELPRCSTPIRDAVQAWARPDCTNLASYHRRTDGTTGLKYNGLCDACYQRQRRHDTERAAQAELAS